MDKITNFESFLRKMFDLLLFGEGDKTMKIENTLKLNM